MGYDDLGQEINPVDPTINEMLATRPTPEAQRPLVREVVIEPQQPISWSIEQMEDGFKAAMEQPMQPDRVCLGKYIMSPGMATPENIARIGRGEAPVVREDRLAAFRALRDKLLRGGSLRLGRGELPRCDATRPGFQCSGRVGHLGPHSAVAADGTTGAVWG